MPLDAAVDVISEVVAALLFVELEPRRPASCSMRLDDSSFMLRTIHLTFEKLYLRNPATPCLAADMACELLPERFLL